MKRLTITDARELVGRRVIYLGPPTEAGVIERVTEFYVFVRYDGGHHSHAIATDADRLVLESSPVLCATCAEEDHDQCSDDLACSCCLDTIERS